MKSKATKLNNALGEYLCDLRKEHGYSQVQVADMLGVIRQTYSHYETGRIIPPIRILSALADIYNADIRDFTHRLTGGNGRQSVQEDTGLPEYLHRLRMEHGYKQSEIADMLGIIQQTYSHYETGRITPPLRTLHMLAELYGVSIDDMMQRSAAQDRSLGKESNYISDRISDSEYFSDISYKDSKYVSRRYLTDDEQILIDYYSELSHDDKIRILDEVKGCTKCLPARLQEDETGNKDYRLK